MKTPKTPNSGPGPNGWPDAIVISRGKSEGVDRIVWEQIVEISKEKRSRDSWHVRRFLDEVNIHFPAHHAVAFYSEKLHICPDYLRQVCQKVLFIPPSHCTGARIILEAQAVLLHQEELSIGEIAWRLGFADHSHFNKFFVRYTGVSPARYRRCFL